MNDMMAQSDLGDLTPIQRVAHLAYWYMSEVYNGGHDQFVSNHSELDHHEVVRALESVGATEQAGILGDFLRTISATSHLEHDAGIDSSRHDAAFGSCKRSIEACLEDYLDKHETEFIEWTP